MICRNVARSASSNTIATIAEVSTAITAAGRVHPTQADRRCSVDPVPDRSAQGSRRIAPRRRPADRDSAPPVGGRPPFPRPPFWSIRSRARASRFSEQPPDSRFEEPCGQDMMFISLQSIYIITEAGILSPPVKLRQHGAGDLLPFLLQGRGRRVLAGTAVPAAGIALVALDPMQIGMRPGALLVMRILAAAMRLVPITLGLPPQRLRRAADPGRRRRPGDRRFELLELHLFLHVSDPDVLLPLTPAPSPCTGRGRAAAFACHYPALNVPGVSTGLVLIYNRVRRFPLPPAAGGG